MADHLKHDSGKGIPASGEGNTSQPQVPDARLIPGGSLDNAATPIGMNAVDREDLPSYGKATAQVDYRDTPESGADRPARSEEPGTATSTANGPGVPRSTKE
jgi:hypothetical protein